jgi:hypothetical protein
MPICIPRLPRQNTTRLRGCRKSSSHPRHCASTPAGRAIVLGSISSAAHSNGIWPHCTPNAPPSRRSPALTRNEQELCCNLWDHHSCDRYQPRATPAWPCAAWRASVGSDPRKDLSSAFRPPLIERKARMIDPANDGTCLKKSRACREPHGRFVLGSRPPRQSPVVEPRLLRALNDVRPPRPA